MVVDESGSAPHPGRSSGTSRERRRPGPAAFLALGAVDDEAISAFYDEFANRLADDEVFAPSRRPTTSTSPRPGSGPIDDPPHLEPSMRRT